MAENTENSGEINAQPSGWGNVRTYLDELKFVGPIERPNPPPQVTPPRQVRIPEKWNDVQSIDGPAMSYLPADATLQALNPTTTTPVVRNPFDINYPDITQMSEDDAFAWLQFCADGSATGIADPYLSALLSIDHFRDLRSEEYNFLLEILHQEADSNIRNGVNKENPHRAEYSAINLTLVTWLRDSQVMHEHRQTYQTYANIIAEEFLTSKSTDFSKKDFGPYLKNGVNSVDGMLSMPSEEIRNVMKKLRKKIELGKDKYLITEQAFELLCEKYTALSFIHDFNKEVNPDAKSKREKNIFEKGWDFLVHAYSRAEDIAQLGVDLVLSAAAYFSNRRFNKPVHNFQGGPLA